MPLKTDVSVCVYCYAANAQVWILPPGLELKSPGMEPRIPKLYLRRKAHNISGFFTLSSWIEWLGHDEVASGDRCLLTQSLFFFFLKAVDTFGNDSKNRMWLWNDLKGRCLLPFRLKYTSFDALYHHSIQVWQRSGLKQILPMTSVNVWPNIHFY